MDSTHAPGARKAATPHDDEPAPARAGRDAAPAEPISNHHFQRPVVSPVPPRSAPPRPAAR